ncbi:ATP-binding protein [Ruminococcus sp.]|uniref:AAA family ATPase n=1 Tax=Ruminococcus sp. TaxID=41978 RepID=UPI001B1C64B2|nr:ATP-binding protein [Ruminococcus sp.]MBO5557549.1 ATP-binding protein [Ruminococcus sp.]
MLLKYSVSNFKSIGHNIEFSMLPLEDTDDSFLTEIDTVSGKFKVLRRGAFFGPNASGKTSFIKSIDFARNYILTGPLTNSITGVDQFRGNIAELEEITTFQFMILANKTIYAYGFSLDRYYVHEEWLEVLNSNKFELMFERHTDESKKTTVKIYSKYARRNSKERQLAELLETSIKEKQAGQLFLKKLAENGSRKADTVFSWFSNIRVIYPNSSLKNWPFIVQANKEFREFLSYNLNAVDTGIHQISTSKSMQLNEFLEKYPLSSDVIKDIEMAESGTISINGMYFHFKDGEILQIEFEHLLNGQIIKFNLENESDGTQRIIDILPILFKSVTKENDNLIYIIDELDRSLHTKLTKYIVNNFIQLNDNSQLVFTTHDVNLLDLDNFKQEELWFIDKKTTGETSLKPFSDFDVSNKKSILNDYLAGRFGAIPVIKGDN